MDSPGLLEGAAARGDWRPVSWDGWLAVRDRPKPASEAVWLSDYLVADCMQYGSQAPRILWYKDDAVGERISREGGFPLFCGGEGSSNRLLQETGDRSIVISVNAYGQGVNLQAWNEQLLTSPSANGLRWEQLLARTHREGQRADTVMFNVYLHTPEFVGAFFKAREQATYQTAIDGSPKRLNYATILL
jgi:hypothetical protein